MIRLGKHTLLIALCLLLAGGINVVRAGTLPAVEGILQQGFPERAGELAKITQSLFQEYQHERNVVSLIFYAYGLLLQAQYFNANRDYINAAEYSRTAFFYLDEAVEEREDNPRVRYLRARVDAWLPAGVGRCVITLNDTAHLLEKMQGLTPSVLIRINMMRYRALFSCHKFALAEQLMQQIEAQDRSLAQFITAGSSGAPPWDVHEINEIVIPLLKGE